MIKKFSKIPWEAGSDRAIIIPYYVGGGELRDIAMNLQNITLTIRNIGVLKDGKILNESTIKIVCERPEQIFLRSDHLQNVIEDIYIFERVKDDFPSRIPGFEIEEAYDFVRLSNSKYIIVVTPKTGIELLACTGDIRFEEAVEA